jgi:A/G-specific adenine glycosylase
MLQQTQVATAVPYYARFLDRFPDVAALARAGRGDVLAAWAGLGYYRRARHLHEAAGVVVREHAGSVPSDPRAFAALPGVGRYTLGAVLSMGFGRSLPVLDGNVARVFSRLTAEPVTVKRPADAKRLWDLAERLMPMAAGSSHRERLPGQWNQALMELGAMVCTPRSPRCSACPVRRHCAAHARGVQHELPPVPGRRAVERVRRAVACVWDRGRLLVARREGALLAGLWEPPGVELSRGEDAGTALNARLAEIGVRLPIADSGRRERHTITHRLITVEVWEGVSPRPASRATATRKWVSPGGDASIALSALAARLLAGGASAGAANGADLASPPVRGRVRRKSRGARAEARAPRGTATISRASRRA